MKQHKNGAEGSAAKRRGEKVHKIRRSYARARRQAAFLGAFEVMGTITAAAQKAGIDRSTHYHWLATDPKYAEAFDEAVDVAAEQLEAEARRRAVKGIDVPVIYQGKPVGVWVDMAGRPVELGDPAAEAFIPLTVKRYSDELLIVLLKALKPEKYRNVDAWAGEPPGPIRINVQVLQVYGRKV